MTAREDHLVKGVVYMGLGSMLVPVMDAVAKGFSGHLDAPEIAFWRFALQILWVLPFTLRLDGARAFRPAQLGVHIGRGAAIALATMLFFAGVQVMPQAEATTIVLTQPLMVALLAPWLLKEKTHLRVWVGAVIGFLGVLLMIQPGSAFFQPAALLPLAAGASFAWFLLMNRRLAGSLSVYGLQFTAAAVGAALLGGMFLISLVWPIPHFVFKMPQGADWALLGLMSAAGAAGHVLMSRAALYAPAAVTAPCIYLSLVSATVLGYALFGDLPSLASWGGMALIVGSGLYVGRARTAKGALRQAA